MKGGVRQRGLTWSYYFDLGIVDGKRKKKEKGGFRTKGDVDKALRKAMTEYENAGSVIDQSNITVFDYFDYWNKEYVLINCKYNTVLNANAMIALKNATIITLKLKLEEMDNDPE